VVVDAKRVIATRAVTKAGQPGTKKAAVGANERTNKSQDAFNKRSTSTTLKPKYSPVPDSDFDPDDDEDEVRDIDTNVGTVQCVQSEAQVPVQKKRKRKRDINTITVKQVEEEEYRQERSEFWMTKYGLNKPKPESEKWVTASSPTNLRY